MAGRKYRYPPGVENIARTPRRQISQSYHSTFIPAGTTLFNLCRVSLIHLCLYEVIDHELCHPVFFCMYGPDHED